MDFLLRTIFLLAILMFSQLSFAANKIDLSEWSKFADSLKTCKAGTFNLPDPILSAMSKKTLYEVYKINGMSGENCEVLISRQIPGSRPPVTLSILCTFSKEQLAIVVQGIKEIAQARVLRVGAGSSSKILSNGVLAKTISTACKKTRMSFR